MRKYAILLVSALTAVPAIAAPGRLPDVPENLVVDFRLIEMRSSSPNYQAMSELSFFINTDGAGVSEAQWLATIAQQVPDAFLATLVTRTVPVADAKAALSFEMRSRRLRLEVDVGNYLPQGTFEGQLDAQFERRNEVLESFTRGVELRSGQTIVLSSHELELSSSDYLSLFRDFDDADHRGRIYRYLRNYSIFLVLAMTLRTPAEPDAERVAVEIPEGAELPELVSPAGVRLVGTIALEFDVDDAGAPQAIRIARSSIPELNPRIVGALTEWRFHDVAGRAARIELTLEAPP